ncbi:Glycerol-3-phosphate acyltransferase [Deinococcus proteolyticus MRP]|uniref:Glycerol-3-phosphate acyltransferase n=1 Tax=Deinococcus proteolyticus (strain ATCC 35074 / DSM 20540 / JCM 6276 / NBRC 101906 / NCIMB 13154 / VKM Ac-1939 / CCM 2703 / MRP) TaxID=693977 RepID=F0RN44_DEIPM|nr:MULTISPECIES: glycerol-3-phosphate 1-O-acyltransferase PlsY [Deinococcus]ADY26186.1 Glycerol-3-phosphate acyltransferase [Deinococcus proteolyticus MRP]MCY1702307.1 glycerol-3-phosphate 1-O-acyltransferase PlsY [Deinococcus sp. SL84]
MRGVTLTDLLMAALSYLLGAVPAAAWVARSRGVDIRTVGSGNSGATNVLRSLGKGPAAFVALFDILKGVLAVTLARMVDLDPQWVALCGVLAVVGHNFSVFLGGRGGKGVATSFGTVAALSPAIGFFAFVLAIFTMWLTRFVSAGSIIGAAAVLALLAFSYLVRLPPPWYGTAALAFLALLLIWQHRDNIGRLTSGTERRLGEKA